MGDGPGWAQPPVGPTARSRALAWMKESFSACSSAACWRDTVLSRTFTSHSVAWAVQHKGRALLLTERWGGASGAHRPPEDEARRRHGEQLVVVGGAAVVVLHVHEVRVHDGVRAHLRRA